MKQLQWLENELQQHLKSDTLTHQWVEKMLHLSEILYK